MTKQVRVSKKAHGKGEAVERPPVAPESVPLGVEFRAKISDIIIKDRCRTRFPDLTEMAASIKRKQLQAVVLSPNMELVDGECRCRAAVLAGEETILAVKREVEDLLDAEIEANVLRDSFDDFDAKAAADKLIKKYRRSVGRPKSGDTPYPFRDIHELVDWAAKKAGLQGRGRYETISAIEKNAPEDVKEALCQKAITRNRAYLISMAPKDKQTTFLNESINDPDSDATEFAKWNAARRKKKRSVKRGRSVNHTAVEPKDRYIIARCSPEWHSEVLSDLKDIPVRDYLTENGLLFVVAPNEFVSDACELIKAWGFHYHSMLTFWIDTEDVDHLRYLTQRPVHVLIAERTKGKGYTVKPHQPKVAPCVPCDSASMLEAPFWHIDSISRDEITECRLLDVLMPKPHDGWESLSHRYGKKGEA